MFDKEVVPAKEGWTFVEWMAEVDRLIALRLLGLTSADLPDHLWHDDYDSGVTPEEAVDDYMEELEDDADYFAAEYGSKY